MQKVTCFSQLCLQCFKILHLCANVAKRKNRQQQTQKNCLERRFTYAYVFMTLWWESCLWVRTQDQKDKHHANSGFKIDWSSAEGKQDLSTNVNDFMEYFYSLFPLPRHGRHRSIGDDSQRVLKMDPIVKQLAPI